MRVEVTQGSLMLPLGSLCHEPEPYKFGSWGIPSQRVEASWSHWVHSDSELLGLIGLMGMQALNPKPRGLYTGLQGLIGQRNTHSCPLALRKFRSLEFKGLRY